MVNTPDGELIEILYPAAIAEITMPFAFIIQRDLFSAYVDDSTQEYPVTPY